jgi:hypothetical protein
VELVRQFCSVVHMRQRTSGRCYTVFANTPAALTLRLSMGQGLLPAQPPQELRMDLILKTSGNFTARLTAHNPALGPSRVPD